MINNPKKRPDFACALLALLCLLNLPAHTQEVDSETLKAALVYKMLQHIEWPENTKNLHLAYWGNDHQQWRTLQQLDGRPVNQHQLTLTRLNTINPSQKFDILLLDQSNSRELGNISHVVRDKGALLISDNASEDNLIMLNLTYTNAGKISFELNRYQIISAGLNLSNNILLLGGSEVDIARALDELNTELISKHSELKNNEKKLNKLSADLIKNREKLTQKQEQIKDTQQRLEAIQTEHQNLINSLKLSREQLQINNNLLSNQKSELTTKENAISQRNQLIEDNKTMLTEQSSRLEQQRDALDKQENELISQLQTLQNQGSKIKTQTLLLAAAGLILFILLLAAIVIIKTSMARKIAYIKLEKSKHKTEEALSQLKETQEQLVQTEKMAALGSLVAGVAHEINTPLGVGVTAASHIVDTLADFKASYQSGNLKRSDFDTFIQANADACDLLLKNLTRAGDLIRNFKQVAVDQGSEEQRTFNLHMYCLEVWDTLYHHTKQKQIKLLVDIDQQLNIHSYPGMLSQIFTNLIMNSVIHGFHNRTEQCQIHISAEQENNKLIIHYHDNGSGIDSETQTHIFEPFFTTKRGEGGSGLGMHITYNLAKKLGGDVRCLPCDTGAHFELSLLLSTEEKHEHTHKTSTV